MGSNDKHPLLLTLHQIAAWTHPRKFEKDGGTVRVTLPALQRDNVWSVAQTEMLWDSIVRRFPIGSFLITPYNKSHGQKAFEGQETPIGNPTHSLLDGQQRATAIALGFYDPWDSNETEENKKNHSVLWLDLCPLENAEEDSRRYIFRMVTRSNPWGFKSKDPDLRVSAADMRRATHAWSELYMRDEKPHEIPLFKIFPWDVKAPVPTTFLFQAANGSDQPDEIAKMVLTALNKLPLSEKINYERGRHNATAPTTEKFCLAREILECVRDDKISDRCGEDHLEYAKKMFLNIHRVLTDQTFPALEMDISSNNDSEIHSKETDNDEIAVLFRRINSSGTNLTAEEINYSLLKAAWPDAVKQIDEGLLKDYEIARPSRLVSLLARLCIAIDRYTKSQSRERGTEKNSEMPGTLSVTQFRRRIMEEDFADRLKDFCEGHEHGKAENIIKEAWGLLNPDANFGLPKYLAADIAATADDVMLLVLFWVYRAIEAQKRPSQLYEVTRRRALGFVTAVAWFAKTVEKRKCTRTLWRSLFSLPPPDVAGFFGREQFNSILRLDEEGARQMIPLPPPDLVRPAISEARKHGILESRSTDGEPWERLDVSGWKFLTEIVPEIVVEKYPNILGRINGYSPRVAEGRGMTERHENAWREFVYRSWNFDLKTASFSLVLYAQRRWITEWFPWYDPTLPKQIEARSRPWDYDHILPSNWVYRRWHISELVREGTLSTGNRRAWPFELNRSDSDSGPDAKLGLREAQEIEDESRNIYDIKKTDLATASFIKPKNAQLWRGCKPESGDFKDRGAHWDSFLEAVGERYADLYAEWYNELHIGELMPIPANNDNAG